METKNHVWNPLYFRLLVIGVLILLLMIPSGMIASLVNERQNRKGEALEEITSKWAQAQTIGGPVITIPYEQRWRDEKGKLVSAVTYIHILPQTLTIEGNLTPEIRNRGIYKAVLYNTKVNLAGDFSFTQLETLNIQPEDVRWNDAFISIYIPDLRGIKKYVQLNWNKQTFLFEPGVREGLFFDSGINLKIPLNRNAIYTAKYSFNVNIDLNGSESFNLLPLGKTTSVRLNSSWNNPSFTGAFLPEKRTVSKEGFTAQWSILDLNRNYPQQWVGETYNDKIFSSKFGVEMFSPVDEYTQTNRAIKYIIMFVGLTFLVFFLVEIFNKKRIHPMQYFLIGLSLCIFYILLLSLSEHLYFGIAYLLAALSIIILISLYVKSAFGGTPLALTTAGLLIALYGYLYVLLRNQDFALLIGSIGIFTIMAIVMYLSRKIDWYKIEINETPEKIS